ncbi:hypothetical protein Aca07nite_81500 [Actinoplanes capillaceus]|uniref:Uncharacterized protein n=1 Tax=Actinoplanes campanulatus TaxID=113559 RepID=A0ABQ3WX74_9ACTN|nr:hypothetical protein [Actinoplanes capillaceus]GID50875.1 hypothetical protein Aca07nite_81500 [Actinoplanes capillaceus]
MDVDEASKALAEMQRRNEQTLRQGSPSRLPAWYTFGTAAALMLIWASGDVKGWLNVAMIAAGVGAIIVLTRFMERITGVRLRARAQRVAPTALLIGAMLIVAIVVGSVMRLYDVAASNTIGGLAASIVLILGVGPAQAAAARPRKRP